MIHILVQRRRSANAAKRFFWKLSKRQGSEPRWLITDKLSNGRIYHRTKTALYAIEE